MKKVICVLICLLLLALMPGCSGGDSGSTTTVLTGGSSPSQPASPGSGQSSSAPSPQGKSIKPEQLISSEEAAGLIGEAVKAGVSDEYGTFGLSICFYAAANPGSMNYLQIAIIQQASGEGGQTSEPSASGSASQSPGQSSEASQSGGQTEPAKPKDIYEGLKKLFSDPNASITGRLGDDTFITSQGISILSGEYYICITVGSFSPEAAQAILKQAGDMALKNLKRIIGE